VKEDGMYARRNREGRHEVVDRETELIIRTLDTPAEANQFIDLVKEPKKR